MSVVALPSQNVEWIQVQPVLTHLKTINDERGNLSFAEVGASLPFIPARFFIVYDVPGGASRGGHAHKNCHQFLIAVSGSVQILLDDGTTRREFVLNHPHIGLHVPPGIWGEQRYQAQDSRLLVLASEAYDSEDYIRDPAMFRAFRKIRP